MTTFPRSTRPLIWLAALLTAAGLLLAPSAAAYGGVVDTQRRLNDLGCNAGPLDGVSGTWTRSAVIRFQSRSGLGQTGVVDATTRSRLFATKAPRCDQRPVPARSGEGRRIVISQAQNWVWLIGPDGRVLVQGGVVDNPALLRPGSYRHGSYCGRAAKIRRNTTASGSVIMDNFVRFAPCGIGFHRIPTYPSSGAQIHPDYLLGTNLSESHGCIRVSLAMSQRIWDFVRPGTLVRVV